MMIAPQSLEIDPDHDTISLLVLPVQLQQLADLLDARGVDLVYARLGSEHTFCMSPKSMRRADASDHEWRMP